MARLTLFLWLLCSFTGTLLLYFVYLITASNEHDSTSGLGLAGIALGVSLATSIPAMIGFGFIGNAVYRRSGIRQARIATSVYALFATLVTFFIILMSVGAYDGSGDSEISFAYLLAIPYILAFIIFIYVLKWPGQQQPLSPEPDTLWDDDSLNPARPEMTPTQGAWELPAAPRPAIPPANVFYTIIAIMVLGFLITLYQILQPYLSFRDSSRGLFHPHIAWLVSEALAITALIFFCLRQSTGWKLAAAVTAANLAGTLLSILNLYRFFLHSGIHSYLLYTALYVVMDIVLIILLLRPSLRRAFHISDQQQWLWILCGAGFGILRVFILNRL